MMPNDQPFRFVTPLLMLVLVLSSCSSTEPACDTPSFYPDWWNDGLDAGGIQEYNNCYNYAMNYVTDLWYAHPGDASVADPPAPLRMWALAHDDSLPGEYLDCERVVAATVRDGAFLASGWPDEICPDNDLIRMTKIALFVRPSPDLDYHFMRQDRDGTWSHKSGKSRVTNLDLAGDVITDPRTAAMARYEFCEFFCICSSRRQGEGNVLVGR